MTVEIRPGAGGGSVLTTELVLPGTPADVFPFFATAGNLERLTPPWLHFRILTPLPLELRAGALIDYRLRLHGLPIRWQTEITAWDPPHRFADEQARGPYRWWIHEHRFEAEGDGTRCLDRVDYGLPFAGRLANRLFVTRDLQRIFEFRAEVLRAAFAAAGKVAAMPYISVSRRDETCILLIDRPDKLNALSTAVEQELDAALVSEEVRTARVVVFAGAGRAFSAGADISEFRGHDLASILAYYRETGGVFERVAALPQPTIAALHGWCLGGGLELALACDFRIADATTRLGLPETAIGIVPSSGGLLRIARLLGTARAKELVLLYDHIDATEAHRVGLVTEAVSEHQALPRAIELGEQLARRAPLALELAKQALDVAADGSAEAVLLVERLAWAALAGTADATEAVDAFEQRRAPEFKGR